MVRASVLTRILFLVPGPLAEPAVARLRKPAIVGVRCGVASVWGWAELAPVERGIFTPDTCLPAHRLLFSNLVGGPGALYEG